MIATSFLTVPQPDPIAQPAPTGLVWALLLLTFFLHLLAMNAALGGAILGAVARLRARAGHAHAAHLSARVSKLLPVAISLAVTFGVAPLLFLQVIYGRTFFVSSVLIAFFWIAVIPTLIVAYYGAYFLSYRGTRPGGAPVVVSWLVALLLIAIAFVYVNNMSLMLRTAQFVPMYQTDARGWHLNLGDPTFVPRFLHFVLSAIAVGGLWVAVLGSFDRGREAAAGDWAIRYGASWCAAATGLNVIAGFWWLLVLPRPVLVQFMSRVPAVALFLGVTSGLVALFAALMAARARAPARGLWAAVIAMLLTLVAMTLSRDQLRTVTLSDAGFQANPWTAPQWTAIVIFVLLLVAALGTVAWMVAALARGNAHRAAGD
jgi:hypothetical protein